MTEPVIGVRFGTPPPKPARGGYRRGPSKEWQKAADDLRANPGEWAHLEHPKVQNNRQAHGVAVRIRNGALAAFYPQGSFEAVVRGENRDQVWARYVGDPVEGSAPAEAAPNSESDVVVEDDDTDEDDVVVEDDENEPEGIVKF